MADNTDYLLQSYDFHLPETQIAQHPPQTRGASRLLLMPRTPDSTFLTEHHRFDELPDLLPEGALLVANNSRVLQARLLGTRETGGKVEFLLLTPLPLLLQNAQSTAGCLQAEADGLLRCGGKVRDGESIAFGPISITVLASGPFGQRRVRLHWQGDLAAAFAATGHMPLPPYIKRPDSTSDANRYQTVYARKDKTGSVAAPTAGLHFTPEMRERLKADGFSWAEVTLYVGYGTFSPVRCQDIRQHQMHSEYVEISADTARAVERARAEKRPIVAVGTTSARALEGVAQQCGQVQPFAGWTDIFLYPGRAVRVIDGLLTNFHLPGSSLLMLVSAFAGRERILTAYAEAVERGYRFFSYGDAMLIIDTSFPRRGSAGS
ncbi:MAG: tRNA preQ1(34) S-adenosylmethionine ribosyltransferase-isomerase QueA [Desulfovibrionaceae bacterium]|nr:tRNA preQ1(34) S-adenosylmethionine ribosyltransferase-isomerase QueA [Desulfovibrionaceae bacterium]